MNYMQKAHLSVFSFMSFCLSIPCNKRQIHNMLGDLFTTNCNEEQKLEDDTNE